MGTQSQQKLAIIAKVLMLVGLLLVIGGAVTAMLVEPWFIGAAIVAAGAGDLAAALVLARKAGSA